MFYKHIENGIITHIGESGIIRDPDVEISEEEYITIDQAIKDKPEDTLDLVYRMTADGQYEGQVRTHEETVEWYQMQVAGGMSIEDVPEEYRAILPTPEPSEEYKAGYDQAVLDMTELEG